MVNVSCAELEERCLEFLRECRQRGMIVTGPMLCTLAQEEAKDLGMDDFKASEGWIHKFKSRHQIQSRSISGESKSVNIQVVEDWKAQIPDIIGGYSAKDIFNCDESGLFYKTTSQKSLVMPNDGRHGGKKYKERVTMLLACSMSGEKVKPLIVGKTANPRALKGANKEKMPVAYAAQSNAWMDGELFEHWLQKFDADVGRGQPNRRVLLFMDNASVHKTAAESVASGLRHTKVILLPKNTTSHTQPLDAGIIQAVKLVYRKHLHSHVMHRLKSDMGCNPMQDINIALVLTWVMKAWKSLRPRTISRCFAKCGFIIPKDGAAPIADLDPILTNEDVALHNEEDSVKFPPPLPAGKVMEMAKKALALRRLDKSKEEQMVAVEPEEEVDEKLPPTSSCIVKALQDLQVYATLRGDTEFLDGQWDIAAYMDIVKGRSIQEATQTRITNFFSSCRSQSSAK